jgi:hypothetical protein
MRLMSGPDYLAPMGRGGRIFGAVLCGLLAVVAYAGSFFGFLVTVQEPKDGPAWTLALVGLSVGSLLVWYAIRIVRNTMSRGGTTTMPRWLIGIFGVPFTAAAVFTMLGSEPHVRAAPAVLGGMIMIGYGFFGKR